MPNKLDDSSYNQQAQQQPPKTLEVARQTHDRRRGDRRYHDNTKAKQRDAALYLSAINVENQEKNRLKKNVDATNTSVSAYHQTVKIHANWHYPGSNHIKTL